MEPTIAELNEALRQTTLARDKHFGELQKCQAELADYRNACEKMSNRIGHLEVERTTLLFTLAQGKPSAPTFLVQLTAEDFASGRVDEILQRVMLLNKPVETEPTKG
jgi:hypothetical protein